MRLAPLLLAGLLALPLGAAQGPAGNDAAALALAAEVRGEPIHDRIAVLSTQPATAQRMMGLPSHDAARDVVADWFRDAGLEPVLFEHDCVIRRNGQDVPVPAASVLALAEGRDRATWAVVGGHFDTREASAGALDNAAGTAIVAELAQAFAARRASLDASVLFAAWDCEEWGVWGSREFVARFAEVEELLGFARGTVRLAMAVSLDMPGLSWPAANVWPSYHKGEYSVLHVRTSPIDTFGYKASYGEYNRTNYTDAQLAGFRAYRETVKHAAFDLLQMPPRWVWVEDDTHGRSDHVPFIAAGVPGMRVHGPSDEEYPPYHTAADTLPAVEASAGGRERFVQGLEAAARLVAVTAGLVTLAPPEGAPPAQPPRAAPAFEALLAVASVALAAAASRR